MVWIGIRTGSRVKVNWCGLVVPSTHSLNRVLGVWPATREDTDFPPGELLRESALEGALQGRLWVGVTMA